MSDDDLRSRLKPFLEKDSHHSAEVIDKFLQLCRYHSGKSYGDVDAFLTLASSIQEFEEACPEETANRLFYFAIPPNVFADTGVAIRQTCMADKGWTRLIVEKPFGRDLESFEELNKKLAENFTEDHIYRIDHYLGKEMVQNLTILRFSNIWFERVWSAHDIQCIILTFKEPFGTEGRGGYFDQYGIIRDILQNHLLQVLTLMCMEAPSVLEGPEAGKAVRDAKVAVLNAIQPIKLEDCVLGQYKGYADDPTIENKDTNTPTFAMIKLYINTPRWHGVPIFMKAGKALDEKKAEMRIQFKDAPAANFLFQGLDCPRNELVMRLQPNEAIYFKTNIKSPGFVAKPIQSELEVEYSSRYFEQSEDANPEAYTRLIYDVLQGKHAAFVRDDELRRAWEIFTPILHQIETEGVQPIIYEQGSRGPKEADEFVAQAYRRNEEYVFYPTHSKWDHNKGLA
jgi:glucose-6-phosphate 1-dehydrogenase